MSQLRSTDGEFDFQKLLFNQSGERVATEREITLKNKLKVIAFENIDASVKPKVIALYSEDEVATVKNFDDLINQIILGIAEESASATDELYLTTRGIVTDTTITGTQGAPVYANAAGELTLTHTNCKVGILVADTKILINIGKESSDNDLRLTYDFLESPSLPYALRKMTYDRGFVEVPIPAGEESFSYNAIIFENNRFVAVGGDGSNRVIYSDDLGQTWQTAVASFMTNWSSIAYGNGLFVATASSGTTRVMTSPDGITWTNRTSPLSAWKKIIYANGLFVAVASTGLQRVMTSPDGITWTGYTVALQNWQDIAYGNGAYVAVGSSGFFSVLRSVDGVTWTLVTPILSGVIGGSHSISTIQYSGALFYISGSNVYGTSGDGINWNIVGNLSNQPTKSLIHQVQQLIATANSLNELKFNFLDSIYDMGIPDTVNPISALGASTDGVFVVFTSGSGNKFYRTPIL